MKFYKSRAFQIVSVIILLIVGYFVIDAYVVNRRNQAGVQQAKVRSTEANKNLEASSVDVIKASLNLYFVQKQSYPFDIDELTKFLKDQGRDTSILSSSISNLKNF